MEEQYLSNVGSIFAGHQFYAYEVISVHCEMKSDTCFTSFLRTLVKWSNQFKVQPVNINRYSFVFFDM